MRGRVRNEECQLQGQTAEFNEKEDACDEERAEGAPLGGTEDNGSDRDQIDLKVAGIELQTSAMKQKYDREHFKSIVAEGKNELPSDRGTEKASEVQISTEVFCWGDNTKG